MTTKYEPITTNVVGKIKKPKNTTKIETLIAVSRIHTPTKTISYKIEVIIPATSFRKFFLKDDGKHRNMDFSGKNDQ